MPGENYPNRAANVDEFIKAVREMIDLNELEDRRSELLVQTTVADQAIPFLIGMLLADPDPEMRTRAAFTLGKIRRWPEQVVPNLISVLNDQVPDVRWHAANALWQFGEDATPAIPALQKQMNDTSSPVAAFCADVLQRIDPTINVEPSLIVLLRNDNDQNRAHAVQTLGRLKAKRAKPALFDAFANETDARIKDQISRIIALIDSTPDSN